MSEITDLLDLHGAEIARVDDTTYRVLRVVYACQDGQAPCLYCLESDWPTTQAARLAELLRVNDRLAARIVELEAQLAVPSEVAPLAMPENGKIPCDHPGCLDWIKPRGMAAHKRQAHGISITGIASGASLAIDSDERRKCPHCQARPKASGLEAHIDREHASLARTQIERAFAPMTDGDLGWRCAARGCTGAFTRDLHDPDFCTQHAAPRMNGHPAEVAG